MKIKVCYLVIAGNTVRKYKYRIYEQYGTNKKERIN